METNAIIDYFSLAFLLVVLQIIAIDILLGGDNAVVIALACRKLPPAQRSKGIFWGVVGAIGLRVVLIFFAVQLLQLPFLKIVGALLLLWIGVKLLHPKVMTNTASWRGPPPWPAPSRPSSSPTPS